MSKNVEQDKNALQDEFTPSKSNAQFQSYWFKFLEILQTRESFSKLHLKNLEILCQLFVEYDNLTNILEQEGSTYQTEGRYGIQIKARPEVIQRKDTIAEIRQFTKILGIVLDKDKGGDADPTENEWNLNDV